MTAFFCPLKLSTGEDCLFENTSPGDSQKCRPLYIEYAKETKELTKTLHANLNECLNAIPVEAQVYSVKDMRDVKFSFKIDALSTMLDGKCINAIVGNTSTLRCRGCGETNKQFLSNKLSDNSEIFFFNYKIKLTDHTIIVKILSKKV